MKGKMFFSLSQERRQPANEMETGSALDCYVELVGKEIFTTVGVSASDFVLMSGLRHFVGSDFLEHHTNSYSSIGIKPYFEWIIFILAAIRIECVSVPFHHLTWWGVDCVWFPHGGNSYSNQQKLFSGVTFPLVFVHYPPADFKKNFNYVFWNLDLFSKRGIICKVTILQDSLGPGNFVHDTK